MPEYDTIEITPDLIRTWTREQREEVEREFGADFVREIEASDGLEATYVRWEY
jgi:phosphoribosylaminoimidazole-succinocarboxamide synthase